MIFIFQWFDFAFIPKSLEWLDIHNNKIDKIENYFNLSSGFNLQTFDASFNQISEIGDMTLLHGLKNIYLNNNKIVQIAAESFNSLSNLTRVELQNNEMISLVSEAVAITNTGKVSSFQFNSIFCHRSLTVKIFAKYLFKCVNAGKNCGI